MPRWLKRTLLGLGSLILLLLAVVAAWVASNGRWADEAPAPLPAALELRPVTLAPEHNAFFDQLGLRAPSGESANAFGQRVWRGEMHEVAARQLDMPKSPTWNCKPADEDCVQRWRATTQALREEMGATAEYGRRCEALLDAQGYQEPLHEIQVHNPEAAKAMADVQIPPFGPIFGCLRWFQLRAVLAPDAAAARADWTRADAVLRRMAGGVQTLIGHAISWAGARNQTLLLAQWMAHEPGAVVEPAWLEPLPASILQPRTWMAGEAHYQRQTTAALSEPGALLYSEQPNALQAWVSETRLGYLPNATQHRLDADWLARIQAFGALQGAELARQASAALEPPSPSFWTMLKWRNTVGNVLAEVAAPAFSGYFMKQADVVLYQQALRLVVALNPVAPAERSAWLARQPVAPELLARLRVEGDALVVSSWQAEADPLHAKPARFALRPA